MCGLSPSMTSCLPVRPCTCWLGILSELHLFIRVCTGFSGAAAQSCCRAAALAGPWQGDSMATGDRLPPAYQAAAPCQHIAVSPCKQPWCRLAAASEACFHTACLPPSRPPPWLEPGRVPAELHLAAAGTSTSLPPHPPPGIHGKDHAGTLPAGWHLV